MDHWEFIWLVYLPRVSSFLTLSRSLNQSDHSKTQLWSFHSPPRPLHWYHMHKGERPDSRIWHWGLWLFGSHFWLFLHISLCLFPAINQAIPRNLQSHAHTKLFHRSIPFSMPFLLLAMVCLPLSFLWETPSKPSLFFNSLLTCHHLWADFPNISHSQNSFLLHTLYIVCWSWGLYLFAWLPSVLDGGPLRPGMKPVILASRAQTQCCASHNRC